MNLLTTLALCALKEYVSNVKLYFGSTERERSVYKKCCEKGILGSIHHQASIHFVNYEFQNYFSAYF